MFHMVAAEHSLKPMKPSLRLSLVPSSGDTQKCFALRRAASCTQEASSGGADESFASAALSDNPTSSLTSVLVPGQKKSINKNSEFFYYFNLM
jgi:hypothetical protein